MDAEAAGISAGPQSDRSQQLRFQIQRTASEVDRRPQAEGGRSSGCLAPNQLSCHCRKAMRIAHKEELRCRQDAHQEGFLLSLALQEFRPPKNVGVDLTTDLLRDA